MFCEGKHNSIVTWEYRSLLLLSAENYLFQAASSVSYFSTKAKSTFAFLKMLFDSNVPHQSYDNFPHILFLLFHYIMSHENYSKSHEYCSICEIKITRCSRNTCVRQCRVKSSLPWCPYQFICTVYGCSLNRPWNLNKTLNLCLDITQDIY